MGPDNVADLASWAEAILDRIEASPDGTILRARLESAYGGGVVVHSDFRGELGPETSRRMQMKAMHLRGWNVPEDGTFSYRACENDLTLQDAIINGKAVQGHNGECRKRMERILDQTEQGLTRKRKRVSGQIPGLRKRYQLIGKSI